MSSSVLLSVDDHVARLVLNRPDSRNAVDEDLLRALEDTLPRLADDTTVKAVVVSGSGDAFCIGLDIRLLERAFAEPMYFRDVLRRFKRVLLALEALPVPVVAAVNGLARAGGFELMLACDLVVAAEQARMGDTHLAFGIPPGGGATQRAPRKLGWLHAADLLFTGRWIDGKEAASIGLALFAVPLEGLHGAVSDLVSEFRGKSRAALSATKKAMLEGLAQPLERGLHLEIETFMHHLSTDPHSREGYKAYVERREPVWP